MVCGILIRNVCCMLRGEQVAAKKLQPYLLKQTSFKHLLFWQPVRTNLLRKIVLKLLSKFCKSHRPTEWKLNIMLTSAKILLKTTHFIYKLSEYVTTTL